MYRAAIIGTGRMAYWKLLELARPPDQAQCRSALARHEDLVGALATGRLKLGHAECARRGQEMIPGIIASHGLGDAGVPLPLADRGVYVGEADW